MSISSLSSVPFEKNHLKNQLFKEVSSSTKFKHKKLVDTDDPKITNRLLRDIALKYENDIVIINPKGTTIKKSLLDTDLEELEKMEEEDTDASSDLNVNDINQMILTFLPDLVHLRTGFTDAYY